MTMAQALPNEATTKVRPAEPIRPLFARLRMLRNRIGHHHRVGGMDLAGCRADLFRLAGFIDPDLSAWIESYSTVTETLRQKP